MKNKKMIAISFILLISDLAKADLSPFEQIAADFNTASKDSSLSLGLGEIYKTLYSGTCINPDSKSIPSNLYLNLEATFGTPPYVARTIFVGTFGTYSTQEHINGLFDQVQFQDTSYQLSQNKLTVNYTGDAISTLFYSSAQKMTYTIVRKDDSTLLLSVNPDKEGPWFYCFYNI